MGTSFYDEQKGKLIQKKVLTVTYSYRRRFFKKKANAIKNHDRLFYFRYYEIVNKTTDIYTQQRWKILSCNGKNDST